MKSNDIIKKNKFSVTKSTIFLWKMNFSNFFLLLIYYYSLNIFNCSVKVII